MRFPALVEINKSSGRIRLCLSPSDYLDLYAGRGPAVRVQTVDTYGASSVIERGELARLEVPIEYGWRGHPRAYLRLEVIADKETT